MAPMIAHTSTGSTSWMLVCSNCLMSMSICRTESGLTNESLVQYQFSFPLVVVWRRGICAASGLACSAIFLSLIVKGRGDFWRFLVSIYMPTKAQTPTSVWPTAECQHNRTDRDLRKIELYSVLYLEGASEKPKLELIASEIRHGRPSTWALPPQDFSQVM